MVRRRGAAGVGDDRHPVAGCPESEGRLGHAHIGLQPGQHEAVPARRLHCGADFLLAPEPEDLLVEDRRRVGRKAAGKLRHQRPEALHVLGGGDNRNAERARRPHQPGNAFDQRGAPTERQLVEEMLLHVDHREAGALPLDRVQVSIHVHGPSFHGNDADRHRLPQAAPPLVVPSCSSFSPSSSLLLFCLFLFHPLRTGPGRRQDPFSRVTRAGGRARRRRRGSRA